MDKKAEDIINVCETLTEAKAASLHIMMDTSFLKDSLIKLHERLTTYSKAFDKYDTMLSRLQQQLKELHGQDETALDKRPVNIPAIKERIKKSIAKASTLGELQLALGDAYGDVAETQLRIWIEVKKQDNNVVASATARTSKPNTSNKGENTDGKNH